MIPRVLSLESIRFSDSPDFMSGHSQLLVELGWIGINLYHANRFYDNITTANITIINYYWLFKLSKTNKDYIFFGRFQ